MAVAAATGGVCLLIALIKFKPFKQQNNIFKQQQPSTRPMPMQRKHRTIYGRALDTKIMVDFHFEIDFFFCRVAIPPTASNKNIFFSGFCCCQPLYVNMNAFPFARTTCNLLRNFWRRMKTKCFTYMPAGKYNGKPARKSFMICVVCKEIRFVVMKVSLPLAERRKCVEWAMQMPSKWRSKPIKLHVQQLHLNFNFLSASPQLLSADFCTCDCTQFRFTSATGGWMATNIANSEMHTMCQRQSHNFKFETHFYANLRLSCTRVST